MTAARPRQRVACPCGWVGYRVNPNARDCPARGCPREKIEALWTAGQGPGRSMVYLLHFHWPPRLVDGEFREVPPAGFHARHYCGWTTDLPSRLRDHLAGVYIRGEKQRGRGARLVAAAIAAGATVEVARIWYAPRAFEQHLKQRRKGGSTRCGAKKALTKLCPICDGRALRRYPQERIYQLLGLKDPAQERQERHKRAAARGRHRAEVAAGVWDADLEWEQAFPNLAYNAPEVEVAQA